MNLLICIALIFAVVYMLCSWQTKKEKFESWSVNRFGPVYKGGYVYCGNCSDGEIPQPSTHGNRLDLDCWNNNY